MRGGKSRNPAVAVNTLESKSGRNVFQKEDSLSKGSNFVAIEEEVKVVKAPTVHKSPGTSKTGVKSTNLHSSNLVHS